jgi:predicted O-methyltransferase YrrM
MINLSLTLPPLLEEAFASSKVFDQNGELVSLDSNVSREEALALNLSVRELKPEKSIEIGLAKGVSTLAILGAIDANGSGRHIVCDPFQDDYGNAGIEMVSRAGLAQWWQFHRKYAEEVVPSIDQVQFAFVDASHLFDLTLVEFVLIDKKLVEGGVIGFHDMWMPSLQKLLRFILENRAYEVWRPAALSTVDQSPPPRSVKSSLKIGMANLLGRIPYAENLLASEILAPWQSLNLPNLVMLRKIHHDNRDWKHFLKF